MYKYVRMYERKELMNKKFLFSFLAASIMSISACAGPSGGGGGGGGGGDDPDTPVQPEHTESEVETYMNALKASSVADHLYVHYYRYDQKVSDYNDWDIWAWATWPKSGEGYRFDWNGRTTSADRLTASGNAVMDSFGYVTCDIDLTRKYPGGWDEVNKQMLSIDSDFYKEDQYGVELDDEIGIQIVYSDSRIHGTGFWVNDGSNLYLPLADYALTNSDNTTSYHVFITQEKVQEPTTTPPTKFVDPFDGDTGEKVTYGKDEYKTVNFNDLKAKTATSPLFKNGTGATTYLQKGAGVGYQIMVSSFADSDQSGQGDIYGIYKKLDYLADLGVNVLWLTPIQKSDSYHGYDISDYEVVDTRYGSAASPNAVNGVITAESAMQDYVDLVNAAHAKGMAVVMDLVLNHTSTTNKWFVKSAQLDDTYRAYYQWGNHNTQSQITQDNYWYPYGSRDYSYYAKFGSAMPELNYAYMNTRDAVAHIADFWCDLGVDGFRMDAVKHIFLNDEVSADANDYIISDVSQSGDYSSNLTKNLHFWRQLAYDTKVKNNHPNCFFVGENFDGGAYAVAPYYEGFDSLFDFWSYFNLTTLAARSYGQKSVQGGPTTASEIFTGGGSSTSVSHRDDSGKLVNGSVTWDLVHMLEKYDYYRGDHAINGPFTSNHDIARTINRIAGETNMADLEPGQGPTGLTRQGNISSSNMFNTLDPMATCVQIIELMLPGCTWIYYGDELGMTGNFEGPTTDAHSAYADLWYRQPMKWKSDTTTADADGVFVPKYSVTGSGIDVAWDTINRSALVKSVADKAENKHYQAIRAFARAKSTSAALINGGISNVVGWTGSNEQYVFQFNRSYGNETYTVLVNLGSRGFDSLGGNYSAYTATASYNGATNNKLPAYSAVLLKH